MTQAPSSTPPPRSCSSWGNATLAINTSAACMAAAIINPTVAGSRPAGSGGGTAIVGFPGAAASDTGEPLRPQHETGCGEAGHPLLRLTPRVGRVAGATVRAVGAISMLNSLFTFNR